MGIMAFGDGLTAFRTSTTPLRRCEPYVWQGLNQVAAKKRASACSEVRGSDSAKPLSRTNINSNAKIAHNSLRGIAGNPYIRQRPQIRTHSRIFWQQRPETLSVSQRARAGRRVIPAPAPGTLPNLLCARIARVGKQAIGQYRATSQLPYSIPRSAMWSAAARTNADRCTRGRRSPARLKMPPPAQLQLLNERIAQLEKQLAACTKTLEDIKQLAK